uniref:Ammonium transporter n=1 Tax=Tetraselmis sp. GSL018 TaxID=582737 RepID=A0A061RRM9_9CHLO
MSFQEQACIAELYKPEADSGTEYLRDANDDIFWLLYGSVLVFNMQAGFALLEAGQVRIKNRSNMLLKNVVDVCMGGVVWYLFGYAFAFGLSSNGFIGGSWDVLSGCADYSKWMFQWTFATTSATIVSGAVAERCSFSAYLFMTFLMQGFLYPVVVHWVWSGYGWLGKDIIGGNGLMDFAGSGVVHLTGGTCALVGAVVVGPRAGRFSPDSLWPMRGNSVAFATLGTMTLWFSWYGFNCVSTGSYSAMYEASRVAMATTMSACGGGLAGLVLNLAHTGAPDILQALNGILGGLVAVTAGAPYYEPYVALAGGGPSSSTARGCSRPSRSTTPSTRLPSTWPAASGASSRSACSPPRPTWTTPSTLVPSTAAARSSSASRCSGPLPLRCGQP